jgi:hypothetical protein
MGRVPTLTSAVLGPVLLFWFTAAASADPAGMVVGVSGGCFVESAGARSALQLGTGVQIGDTIAVAADAKLKLRMADGSILAIGSGTRMTVTAYGVTPGGQRQNAQLSMPQGLLHAIVAPTQAPAKFEVNTAVGAAAVRSTDWLIEATANDQQVSVLSGSVLVTSGATRHSVLVPAHQTTRVERGRDPLAPRPLSRAAFNRILGRTELRREPHAERPAARHPGRALAARRQMQRAQAQRPHAAAPPRRVARHPDADKSR